jgi:hypothetical protein
LPTYHKYKKNTKDFFVGIIKRDVAPLIQLGEELYDMVSQYESIVFDFQSKSRSFMVLM